VLPQGNAAPSASRPTDTLSGYEKV